MFGALLHLIFPNHCYACEEEISSQLQHICLNCRNEMPRGFDSIHKNTAIDKLFWGKVALEKSTAFLKFEKNGKAQRLIHHLKYDGKKEIGVTLGEMAAAELMAINFFENIDYLIPVPIHKLKEKIRGYNQSHYIAEGIHAITKIPVDKTSILKIIHTQSQTRKGKFRRWENVSSTFELQKVNQLQGKHLLLIDDVLTTGSTIEACAQELQKIPDVKLSLLAMAYTY